MLIGITGKSGVGKDTAADYLVEKFGYKKAPFAEGLRQEIFYWIRQNQFHNLPKDTPDDVLGALFKVCQTSSWDIALNEKPTPPHIRRLLQWWGTDFRRKQDENYWIKKWINRNVDLILDDKPLIATDIRFRNEAGIIKSLGGIVIKIEREAKSELSDIAQQHESENIFVSCDVVVYNNKTIEEFQRKFVEVCARGV